MAPLSGRVVLLLLKLRRTASILLRAEAPCRYADGGGSAEILRVKTAPISQPQLGYATPDLPRQITPSTSHLYPICPVPLLAPTKLTL